LPNGQLIQMVESDEFVNVPAWQKVQSESDPMTPFLLYAPAPQD
jgi:hypothetical protein